MSERLTPEDLRNIAESLGLPAYGWQKKMSQLLSVTDRTVRRWASGEAAIPDWVESELKKAMGVDPSLGLTLTSRDEWLIADGGEEREYIIHTRAPRFCARVVDIDPLEGTPLPDQGNADVISGITYEMGLDCVLCEIAWLDAPPGAASLKRLLSAAANFYEEHVEAIISQGHD